MWRACGVRVVWRVLCYAVCGAFHVARYVLRCISLCMRALVCVCLCLCACVSMCLTRRTVLCLSAVLACLFPLPSSLSLTICHALLLTLSMFCGLFFFPVRLGANLSYYIGRPAMILVATGAIVTDLMFFAGSAIFPLCSVVTTGRGFGIDGAVGLVVYYVGFFFAFKYVDKILEQQCPMPPQIKV